MGTDGGRRAWQIPAYTVGATVILQHKALTCAEMRGDRRGKPLVDGRDIELWNGDRSSASSRFGADIRSNANRRSVEKRLRPASFQNDDAAAHASIAVIHFDIGTPRASDAMTYRRSTAHIATIDKRFAASIASASSAQVSALTRCKMTVAPTVYARYSAMPAFHHQSPWWESTSHSRICSLSVRHRT